jgi:LysM repeat protein
VTEKVFRLFHIILLILMVSCRAYRPLVSPAYVNGSAETYIDKFKGLAISEMKRTGVPASITLAQGMIESDYGRSTLAREANNHFGIKCHSDWTGPIIRHHDDRRNECFRKYRNAEDSFYDHSDFLINGSRYSSLFRLDPTDYKAWARGLRRAGYATNPDYANMLIRKIEEFNLHQYDMGYNISSLSPEADIPVNGPETATNSDVFENASFSVSNGSFVVPARVSRIMENNRIQYIIVKEGDTVEDIEEEFQLLKWELTRYNELDNDFVLTPGQILYLQPKRERAEPGKELHIATEGDTMYSVSQKYGVKLKKLYEMNRMAEGTEPETGQKLWLRKMKPVN